MYYVAWDGPRLVSVVSHDGKIEDAFRNRRNIQSNRALNGPDHLPDITSQLVSFQCGRFSSSVGGLQYHVSKLHLCNLWCRSKFNYVEMHQSGVNLSFPSFHLRRDAGRPMSDFIEPLYVYSTWSINAVTVVYKQSESESLQIKCHALTTSLNAS